MARAYGVDRDWILKMKKLHQGERCYWLTSWEKLSVCVTCHEKPLAAGSTESGGMPLQYYLHYLSIPECVQRMIVVPVAEIVRCPNRIPQGGSSRGRQARGGNYLGGRGTRDRSIRLG